MDKKKSKGISRRKIIPARFQKRNNKNSLSEILQAAGYRRRVKELLKSNKSLAQALEESQSLASYQGNMLKSFERDRNQIMLAYVKVKKMGGTLQNLADDFSDLLACLDVEQLTSVKCPFNNEFRKVIQEPNLSVIDESVQSFLSESKNCESFNNPSSILRDKEPSLQQKSLAVSNFLDTSATEIYNLQHLLSSKLDETKESAGGTSPKLDITPEVQSPPTPQFVLPKPELNYRSLSQFDGSKKDACNQNLVKSISRIPIPRQNLFQKTNNSPVSPISNAENRRKTFVVSSSQGNDDQQKTFVANSSHEKDQTSSCSFNKRETFTISEISNELLLKNKSEIEKENIFAIPFLPPPSTISKQNFKSSETSSFQQISKLCSSSHQNFDYCQDEKTIHINEDMDLTEIIPSVPVSCSQNLNVNLPSTYFCSEVEIKKEEAKTIPLTVSDLRNPAPLSPITKTSTLFDFKKNVASNLEHENFKKSDTSDFGLKKILLKNDEKVVEMEKNSSNSCKRGKPVLPKLTDPSIRLSNTQSPNTDVVPSDNDDNFISEIEHLSCNAQSDKTNEKSQKVNENLSSPLLPVCDDSLPKRSCGRKSILKKVSEKLNQSDKTNEKSQKVNENLSSLLPVCDDILPKKSCGRKSILKKISEKLNSSISDSVSSDSDPDFVIAMPKPKAAPRIPGRKSIQKNRRRPFIFKATSENKKQANNAKETETVCTSDDKSYSFSSSESDEDGSKKPTISKKCTQKKFTFSKGKYNKSTLAILEKDINLQYQDQSRKKRSLKRVSFAKNLSPPIESDELTSKLTEKSLNANALETINCPLVSENECENLSFPQTGETSCKPPEISNLSCEKSTRHIDQSKTSKKKQSLRGKVSLAKIPLTNSNEEEKNKCAEESKSDNINNLEVVNNLPPETENPDFFQEAESPPKKRETSYKLSEIIDFPSTRSTRSKRTFSGVSERSSKKRVIENDDFLEDLVGIKIDSNEDRALPIDSRDGFQEGHNCDSSNSLKNKMDINIQFPLVSNDLEKNEISEQYSNGCHKQPESPCNRQITNKLDSISESKKSDMPASVLNDLENVNELKDELALNLKTKVSTNKKAKTKVNKSKVKTSILGELTSSSTKKKQKNSDVSTPQLPISRNSSLESLKENLDIPDLGSGGRPRRSRKVTSFKEPSLHTKLRRN